MLRCPFCQAPESDRFDLEGKRFLVFPCTFTPEVDPRLSDEALAAHLAEAYGPGAVPAPGTYFRSTCDRLHLYVTKGDGARALTADARPDDAPDAGPT